MAWTRGDGPLQIERLKTALRNAQQCGSTLLEMMIVIAVLLVIAAVAVPRMSSSQDSTLALATAEVAAAFRFAHSEAIRTGVAHGVHAEQGQQRLRVYRLDSSSNPAVPVYDVYHPLTRQPYELTFDGGSTAATLSDVNFRFRSIPFSVPYLGFGGGTGLPKYASLGSVRMLEVGSVAISHNGIEKTIDVSPMTARVTVQ